MRPARKGPENRQTAITWQELINLASMRPARKGPENQPLQTIRAGLLHRFNEAGPQGAGKPGADTHAAVLVTELQ